MTTHSNNNNDSSIMSSAESNNKTVQLLKVGTLGTALYGLYLGYVSQLNSHVEGQWATLHKFEMTPLEREYLLYIMIPNNVKTLQLEIKNALKVKYGIDPDASLPSLPLEMDKWTDYRQIIDQTIALLHEPTNHSSDSLLLHGNTMDSMAFFKRCVATFHITNESIIDLHAEESINDIKAHVLANMSHTLNADLIVAVGNINRDLKKKMDASGDNHNNTSIQRTIKIIEQAITAGVLNIREVIAFKDKLPSISSSTSMLVTTNQPNTIPTTTTTLPHVIQIIQRICAD
jgi:hypothetical protein